MRRRWLFLLILPTLLAVNGGKVGGGSSSAGGSLLLNAPISWQMCSDPNGSSDTCPDPNGVAAFDGLQAWAGVPGGQYDSNGSTFNQFPLGSDFDVTDYIGFGGEIPMETNVGGTVTVGTSGAMIAGMFTDAADLAFCRTTDGVCNKDLATACTVATQAADCGTSGLCSTEGNACTVATQAADCVVSHVCTVACVQTSMTCQDSGGVPYGAHCQLAGMTSAEAHPYLAILEKPNGNGTGKPRYYPIALYNYTGCNSLTNTASIRLAPAAIDPANDHIYGVADANPASGGLAGLAFLHPSKWYWRWVMQSVLESWWEELYHPAVNMLVNGYMDSNCNGWTATGATSTTNTAFDPTDASEGTGAIYGKSCIFARNTNGTLSILSDPVVLEDYGNAYVIHGFISTNKTSQPRIELFAGDGTTPLTILQQTGVRSKSYGRLVYWGPADANDPVGTTPQNTTDYTQACRHGWCEVFMKFSQTSSPDGAITVKISTPSLAATTLIALDNWEMYPDPWNQPTGFVPFLPNAGNVAGVVFGDSRVPIAISALSDITQAGSGAPWVRPYLAFWSKLASQSVAYPGCTAAYISTRTAGSLSFEGSPVSLVLDLLGVNDMIMGLGTTSCSAFGAGSFLVGPTTLQARMVSFWDRVRRSGARPLHIFDQRMWGDHSSGTSHCKNDAAAATNCAVVQTDFQNLIIKNNVFRR